jgi:hypothetical protein
MKPSRDADSGIRRAVAGGLLVSVTLTALGFFTGSLWPLGVAAWILILVCLTEMVYRP